MQGPSPQEGPPACGHLGGFAPKESLEISSGVSLVKTIMVKGTPTRTTEVKQPEPVETCQV